MTAQVIDGASERTLRDYFASIVAKIWGMYGSLAFMSEKSVFFSLARCEILSIFEKADNTKYSKRKFQARSLWPLDDTA